MKKFNYNIIKGYDIRGIFEKELTTNDIFLIGSAFGLWIRKTFPNNQKIVIGCDNRASSEEIFQILCSALNQFDIKIYNIGLSSSPILSFATINLNCCGIMITASHNNANYNGMKISKPNSESLDGDAIMEIMKIFFQSSRHSEQQLNHPAQLIKSSCAAMEDLAGSVKHTMRPQIEVWDDYNLSGNNNAILKANNIININIFDKYINFLFSHLKITKENFLQKISNKKIAFDFLGSTMEKLAQKFFHDQKNCFFVQNEKLIDEPDPTLAKNLINLQNLIKKNECDFGFAFDGDCDRIVALDENGNAIKIEHLGMILSMAMGDDKKKKIVHDARCSSKLKEFLRKELNFNTYKSKIGHSIIKKTMKEFDSDLSCESSGHFIFKELGFDDGFYVALFLMNYLSFNSTRTQSHHVSLDILNHPNENRDLVRSVKPNLRFQIESRMTVSEIVKNLPEIHCSENIKIYLKNEEITKKLNIFVEKARMQNKEVKLFDGVKILDEDGWIFFRQSRTEECLTIKFEAYEKENFDKKEIEMREFLEK